MSLSGLTAFVARGFDLADFLDPPFEGEAVERVHRQAGENFDAVLQFGVDAEKEAAFLFVTTNKRDGVGGAPMRGDWLSGPDRARFLGGVVADGEDEIELRTARLRKHVPAFAAQPRSL